MMAKSIEQLIAEKDRRDLARQLRKQGQTPPMTRREDTTTSSDTEQPATACYRCGGWPHESTHLRPESVRLICARHAQPYTLERLLDVVVAAGLVDLGITDRDAQAAIWRKAGL